MGANLVSEVAAERYCEATIGATHKEKGILLKQALQTSYFRIKVVDDTDVVEICGALKNIIALAAGFCDGLNCGHNAKSALIRLGILEMIQFCELFYQVKHSSTFFESCGIADLIATCYGGRNRKCGEAFAKCNGQKV